jgi:hypothetical protein
MENSQRRLQDIRMTPTEAYIEALLVDEHLADCIQAVYVSDQIDDETATSAWLGLAECDTS